MDMTRAPTSPGKILREEFLFLLEMSQQELADHIGQDVKVINRIVNGRSAVTAEVALKLASCSMPTYSVTYGRNKCSYGLSPQPTSSSRPWACGATRISNSITRDHCRSTQSDVERAARPSAGNFSSA